MTQLTAPLPRARALSRHGTRAPSLDRTLATGRPARMSDETGVRFAATEAVLAVAALAAAALALPTATRLVVLGAVVAASALVLTWTAALGAAATAWAVWTGFAEHHLGQLSLAPADLERLALLAAVATVGVLVHLVLRGVLRGARLEGAGRRG